MRPTIIPEQLIPPGHRRIIVSPPGGDLTNPDIAPVEALVAPLAAGRLFQMRLTLEDGDIQQLLRGGHIWLSMMTDQLPPFAVRIGP